MKFPVQFPLNKRVALVLYPVHFFIAFVMGLWLALIIYKAVSLFSK